jgi:two-component system sensor histidine kinase/response regulator
MKFFMTNETLLGISTPGHVIIVDDVPESVRFLDQLLTHEGYRVDVAHSGTHALELIFKDIPDLVLLDLMMPGLNGRELLQILRHDPRTEEIAIIMLTAVDTVEDVVDCFELGADDYLTKPAEFEVLLARVHTHVNLKRLRDQRRRDIARLKELDTLKDKFLQIAAHDLKNPLNNFTIGVEVLSRLTPTIKEEFPDYEKVLGGMRDTIGTMRIIIDDFLDLQALEAGQIELTTELVSINEITDKVIQQFTAYADGKQTTVNADLADDLPRCDADPDRLNQVASNLLSNAIKFSPPGSEIQVRTKRTGDFVRLEVEDNGPGIPPDEVPLLFEEFTRLSNRPTGGEVSSGVGLAIARTLIEMHGGQIGVDSQMGKGSVFWFEIPTP